MLIRVKEIAPKIELDLRYATKNNFTGKVHYPIAECFLEEEVAHALARVQNAARALGFSLKIYDGYRPLSVQRAFWEFLPDERFIAHPDKGGKHPRATAVDLTLIDAKGNELLMPTPFDDFSEKAAKDYQDLPEDVIENRALLHKIMERENFIGLDSEWWHFDYHTFKDFPPQDVTFEDLLVFSKETKTQ